MKNTDMAQGSGRTTQVKILQPRDSRAGSAPNKKAAHFHKQLTCYFVLTLPLLFKGRAGMG